jgi:hypothetical protein
MMKTNKLNFVQLGPRMRKIPTTEFTRLGLVVGEPLKALEPGKYEYTQREKAVRLLGPDSPSTAPRKAGRKPAFDWDAIHAEVIRRLEESGPPDNLSEFTNNLLLWCAEQFGEENTPDFETARKYIRRWIEGWDRSLPGD